ncbi:hypothetical protein I6H67_03905 [Pediococcus pentosaceus]|uniref:hypothetical protein n=1 Tax=Pediococcus pentosaceus TaxID=1255 RepID=UPI0018E131D8|nr:hypothetical protein [Pediococcus pentosaceus]MBF7104590.1 hypothetical protein [Pediococcus pentosaceus]QQC62005.1 hypothetical protein I6H67_03905 [Pediococcus pentosaceus]
MSLENWTYIFSFVGGAYAFLSILVSWYQSRIHLTVNATEYSLTSSGWAYARFQIINRSRLPINISSIALLKFKDVKSYELKCLNHESYITTLKRTITIGSTETFDYPLMSSKFPFHIEGRNSCEVLLVFPPDTNSHFEENKYLCCHTNRGKKSFLINEENKSKMPIDKFL